MKGLLKKLWNLVRSLLGSAEKAISEPSRDGKYAIEDAEKELSTFIEKIAKLKRQINDNDKELKSIINKIATMEKVSVAAAKEGNEADVRSALLEKANITKRKDALTAQQEKNNGLYEQMLKQKDDLQTRISNAKTNLSTLVVREEAASIRQELAKAAAGLKSSSALGGLDELEKTVQAAESEAEAYEELAAESKTAENLEDKYSAASSEVDDEVAALLNEHKKAS